MWERMHEMCTWDLLERERESQGTKDRASKRRIKREGEKERERESERE